MKAFVLRLMRFYKGYFSCVDLLRGILRRNFPGRRAAVPADSVGSHREHDHGLRHRRPRSAAIHLLRPRQILRGRSLRLPHRLPDHPDLRPRQDLPGHPARAPPRPARDKGPPIDRLIDEGSVPNATCGARNRSYGSRVCEMLCSRIANLLFCACLLLFASILVFADDDVTSTLIIGGSKIDVTIEAGKLNLSQAELLHWVQSAAEAIATYYGRYPVPRAQLQIIPADGRGVRHGQTFGYNGGLIKIRVGRETDVPELNNDWMLTHEMVHLSFPSMADKHHWIEEGIAVYVEPIARIQAKQMTAEKMWADLVRDMPKGLPQEGDQGLDHTRSWGRTYWGGALFCFVADVEIRRQTQNKKGLQDALRGILDAGGDIRHDWALADALKAGDQAVGVTVLTELYAKWKDNPVAVDLPAMWKQLGIESSGKTIRLAQDAPLAAVRRAITSADSSKQSPAATSLPPSAVFAGRAVASPRARN